VSTLLVGRNLITAPHGYFAYNFIKIHSTLRCRPAMASGVTDRLWEVSDLVALLEADERGVRKSGITVSCRLYNSSNLGDLGSWYA
jgi:hypothetical protein